jgi:hypothetical protein
MNDNNYKFNYESIEKKQIGDTKIIRKVSIKNGKGHKSITKYRKGKKISTVKKPIINEHIYMIKGGKFIVGLFDDCIKCKKTRKRV